MNIEKYDDVVSSCRFCFMCRHLDTVGNVTYQEADTPRGRALILDKVRMNRENLKNPDYVETVYRSALSAACRFHCVSHYDEAGLVLAARRDIVDAGLEPEKVKRLAAELMAGTDTKIEAGAGDIVYYVDSRTDTKQPEIAESFKRVMKMAGISFRVLK
jgi:Fe-S oxidoreductase